MGKEPENSIEKPERKRVAAFPDNIPWEKKKKKTKEGKKSIVLHLYSGEEKGVGGEKGGLLLPRYHD